MSNSTECFHNHLLFTTTLNYFHLVDEKTEYLNKLAKARCRSVWPQRLSLQANALAEGSRKAYQIQVPHLKGVGREAQRERGQNLHKAVKEPELKPRSPDLHQDCVFAVTW